MKNILIAHQSTIPHYRIAFYEAVQKQKPDWWRFDVVYADDRTARKYNSGTDLPDVLFPVLPVRTTHFGKKYCYQHFWKSAGKYDLLVVEHALNNLTYPLCQLHKRHGVKLAYWGHGKDRSVLTPGFLKRRMEDVKRWLGRRADGYLAYTEGVKSFLIQDGYTPDRIFVLNNTVDLAAQRHAYLKVKPLRDALRKEMALAEKTVFIFVGRPTELKGISLLLEAFRQVSHEHNTALLLVGCNGLPISEELKSADVRIYPTITDLDELAKLYTVSDAYVLPGKVGLGPLQAMSCDLPVITIESPTDSPEVEYLNVRNAVILNSEAGDVEYAEALSSLCKDPATLLQLRHSCWETVEHLTVQNMAERFIDAINRFFEDEPYGRNI